MITPLSPYGSWPGNAKSFIKHVFIVALIFEKIRVVVCAFVRVFVDFTHFFSWPVNPLVRIFNEGAKQDEH